MARGMSTHDTASRFVVLMRRLSPSRGSLCGATLYGPARRSPYDASPSSPLPRAFVSVKPLGVVEVFDEVATFLRFAVMSLYPGVERLDIVNGLYHTQNYIVNPLLSAMLMVRQSRRDERDP